MFENRSVEENIWIQRRKKNFMIYVCPSSGRGLCRCLKYGRVYFGSSSNRLTSLLIAVGDTLSLWNCGRSRPVIHPPYDTRVTLEQRWNNIDRTNTRTWRETFSTATFPTINTTLSDTGANSRLRADEADD